MTPMSENAKWYVVHTYSGYENKVKANLEKIIENRGMQNEILQIEVPVQSVMEIKKGQKKNIQRKIFPGYVLIKMTMNDDTWYVVRNTRGVTSFVGPGSKPVALTEDEVSNLGVDAKIEMPNFYIGDTVRVSSGPFEGAVGVLKELNKHAVVVKLSIFGRETPVELELAQIERI
jgi:transcriptional antiterminator NusG